MTLKHVFSHATLSLFNSQNYVILQALGIQDITNIYGLEQDIVNRKTALQFMNTLVTW